MKPGKETGLAYGLEKRRQCLCLTLRLSSVLAGLAFNSVFLFGSWWAEGVCSGSGRLGKGKLGISCIVVAPRKI
jgi:hypothetical protein